MSRFVGADPTLKDALEDFEKLVVAAGGDIHPALRVHHERGSFSFHSDLDPGTEEKLISLPESALLPLKWIKIGLKGDDLVVQGTAPEFNSDKCPLLEGLMTILNLTQKIKTHRERFPWIVFGKDQALVKTLLDGRPDLTFSREIEDNLTAGLNEDWVIQSFLMTRTLEPERGSKFLMPFVDFGNHHFRAHPFGKSEEKKGDPSVVVQNSKPNPTSTECFIRYGNFDAMDLYLSFGYPDSSAPFVRSIPVTLDFGNFGSIKINTIPTDEVQGPLPPGLQNLRFYFPKIIDYGPGFLNLSHMYIPGPNAPRALVRVLEALIKTLSPSIDVASLKRLVGESERKILEKNKAYYQALKAAMLAHSSYSGAEAQSVCDIQLAHLDAYQLL